MPILLKNVTAVELEAQLAAAGLPAGAARRIQAAAVRRDALPEPGPGFPARVRDAVRACVEIPRLAVVGKVESLRDGFAKYLFQGAGPERFEAVRIPLLHRAHDRKYVVCVSSQVGCPLGCAFCATGRMGFLRDLAPWEIVDQVGRIRADSAYPVRGVVFMGMGEPLLNYDAVMTAARILSEPCGMAIAGKAITISTAGIVPGLRRFTREGQPYKLVVSLTSADPVCRRELMPVEAVHPLAELVGAIRAYHAATRRRVTVAWTMISGVNTRAEDASKLAELLRGMPVQIDLIDANDPTGRFRPPTAEELGAFRDALRTELGVPVLRRYSGGQEIGAGCGMLAAGSGDGCGDLADGAGR